MHEADSPANLLTSPHRFTPSPSFRTLEKLRFFPAGRLVRNGNHITRVVESINRGIEGEGTSEDMYRQLNLLQETYPKPVRCHSTALAWPAPICLTTMLGLILRL